MSKYLIGFILLLNFFDLKSEIIKLQTKDLVIVFQTDDHQRLGMVYMGDKLNDDNEYAQIRSAYRYDGANEGIFHMAYTPSGTWNLGEPALSLIHSDGNTSTELLYDSHKTESNMSNVSTTSIVLIDPVYKTKVVLKYKLFYEENVVEQWAEIYNQETGTLRMDKYASANLYLEGEDFYLKHYHGVWAKEMKPETTVLTSGIKTIESKLGARANLLQPPSFVLGIDGPISEDKGKVLLGNLEWTGNFKIDFEIDPYGNLKLIAGINPFASEYSLKAGEKFETPAFVYAYSAKGAGDASRNMHNWARKYKLFDGEGNRLTLLNNWEATYFDFDEQKLVSLFSGAKKLGVDMFLLDDGWFGNKYPRNSDKSGLGDWQENTKKLPNGIPFLVKEAEKAGVKFGIWVEPEMVNPKSELYEKHPDWVIRQKDRPEVYYRNQLVLDLSNPEVQNFVFGVLDTLFTENPKLAFIKWDCNSVIFNAHSAYLEKMKLPQTHLYVDYVKGFYKVMERIRAKYPNVPMMLCSGGGGRADYKALSYFTEFWLSDNTDPIERVFIQWENSFLFPSIASDNHITDWSKVGIKFRTDVAMMGKMGYDIVVDHLDENELTFSQEALKKYDELKPVIWRGDLFRLVDPWENPMAVVQYVSKDKSKSVMFNYVISNRYGAGNSTKPIVLQGLDPNKKYKIQEINVFPGSFKVIDETKVYSGDYLLKIGFNPVLSSRRTSVVLEISEVKN